MEYLNLIGLHATEDRPEVLHKFGRRCFEKFKADLEIAYGPGYGDGKSDLHILKIGVDPEFVDVDSVIPNVS